MYIALIAFVLICVVPFYLFNQGGDSEQESAPAAAETLAALPTSVAEQAAQAPAADAPTKVPLQLPAGSSSSSSTSPSGDKWLGMTHVPVAVLGHDATQRMVATWQFNKARGSHEVDLDADLIRALIQQGMDEDKIAEHLGIDLDTVHRYKQITGIAELFKSAEYSMSWCMVDVSDEV